MKAKLPVDYVSLGAQKVKNIGDKVRVYGVKLRCRLPPPLSLTRWSAAPSAPSGHNPKTVAKWKKRTTAADDAVPLGKDPCARSMFTYVRFESHRLKG